MTQMMIGYGGGPQAYPMYGTYGGYQMPTMPMMPGMDFYAAGGDLNAMMAASYAQMQQQLQMAQMQQNYQRVQQGNLQNNNNANYAGEMDLMKLLRQGVLNREEFVAASATQNEIQRVLARYKSDGQISPQEHAHLAQMRARLQEQLRQFAAGDCRPETNSDDKASQQAGALFDLVKAGKISPNTAVKLRQQMAVAAAQQGAEEGGDPNAFASEKDSVELRDDFDQALSEASEQKAKKAWKLGEQRFDSNIRLRPAQPAYGYR